MGLMWEGFGSQARAGVGVGAAGMTSVRRHQKLCPCQRQFQLVLRCTHCWPELIPSVTPHQRKWMCPEKSCSRWRAHTGAGSCGEKPRQETMTDTPQWPEHLDPSHPSSSATPVSSGHHMIFCMNLLMNWSCLPPPCP